jgi:AraC-like DNA-binding protein
MIRRKSAPPRGVLRSASTTDVGRRRHVRYHPSTDLESYVEHYWSVEWDFRGAAPQRVEILPHPSVHLIFQRDVGARIMGVTRGKFSRLLSGVGSIFAVKFTPGGFHPFLLSPVSTLTDSIASVGDVFGDDGVLVARSVQTARTDLSRTRIVEALLRQRLRPDPAVARVADLVYSAAKDRTIVKVDDLVVRSGSSRRSLERLFAKYVGVSPKWVIQRYRLHEAAEQLGAGDNVNYAALALSLGYSDQAHFVRDFKAVVGTSPAAYARSRA